jgi:hypothetical protein
MTFRRLDSVSIFRWNLLSWAQLTELVPISGHEHRHKFGYTYLAQSRQAMKTFKKKHTYMKPLHQSAVRTEVIAKSIGQMGLS